MDDRPMILRRRAFFVTRALAAVRSVLLESPTNTRGDETTVMRTGQATGVPRSGAAF